MLGSCNRQKRHSVPTSSSMKPTQRRATLLHSNGNCTFLIKLFLLPCPPHLLACIAAVRTRYKARRCPLPPHSVPCIVLVAPARLPGTREQVACPCWPKVANPCWMISCNLLRVFVQNLLCHLLLALHCCSIISAAILTSVALRPELTWCLQFSVSVCCLRFLS